MNHLPEPGAELPFEGARNFRELGGYPAAGGKTIRRGLLYRGIPTAGLTSPADRALIEETLARHAAEIAANPAAKRRYLSMDGVDPEIAPFLLRTLRARNGGAEAYLEAAFGLDASRLARLRSLYLE